MAKTAFLIIDVQEGILTGVAGRRESETDKAMNAMVWRIAALLKRVRAAGVPVIYVQHEGPIGHRLEPGSAGYPIREEIASKRGDILVHKRYCDAFYDTALESALTNLGITHLLVVGCMTQYCIDTSVRRAVSLGYDVTLVGDCHMTADSGRLTFEQIIEHHNTLLDGFDAGEHSVRVAPSAEIVFDPKEQPVKQG